MEGVFFMDSRDSSVIEEIGFIKREVLNSVLDPRGNPDD